MKYRWHAHEKWEKLCKWCRRQVRNANGKMKILSKTERKQFLKKTSLFFNYINLPLIHVKLLANKMMKLKRPWGLEKMLSCEPPAITTWASTWHDAWMITIVVVVGLSSNQHVKLRLWNWLTEKKMLSCKPAATTTWHIARMITIFFVQIEMKKENDWKSTHISRFLIIGLTMVKM